MSFGGLDVSSAGPLLGLSRRFSISSNGLLPSIAAAEDSGVTAAARSQLLRASLKGFESDDLVRQELTAGWGAAAFQICKMLDSNARSPRLIAMDRAVERDAHPSRFLQFQTAD